MNEKTKYRLANLALVVVFGGIALAVILLNSCSKNQPQQPDPCTRKYNYELRDSTGVISSGKWEELCDRNNE